MTLLDLVLSKSSLESGTLIELIQAIQEEVGYTIYVNMGSEISGDIEVMDVSAEIEDAEVSGNIEMIEVDGEIEEMVTVVEVN